MEPERIKVMRFAENNRISHRQLFRQIILVFPAPFSAVYVGAGGYILAVLGQLVPGSLITGMSEEWITFWAVLGCALPESGKECPVEEEWHRYPEVCCWEV